MAIIGEVVREEEHFRVTLQMSASKEWERIETSKVSAWVIESGREYAEPMEQRI